MYESDCASSPRTNFMWSMVLFIQLFVTIFCKHTTVLCKKPTTIAMSSTCAYVSSWHIP